MLLGKVASNISTNIDLFTSSCALHAFATSTPTIHCALGNASLYAKRDPQCKHQFLKCELVVLGTKLEIPHTVSNSYKIPNLYRYCILKR